MTNLLSHLRAFPLPGIWPQCRHHLLPEAFPYPGEVPSPGSRAICASTSNVLMTLYCLFDLLDGAMRVGRGHTYPILHNIYRAFNSRWQDLVLRNGLEKTSGSPMPTVNSGCAWNPCLMP